MAGHGQKARIQYAAVYSKCQKAMSDCRFGFGRRRPLFRHIFLKNINQLGPAEPAPDSIRGAPAPTGFLQARAVQEAMHFDKRYRPTLTADKLQQIMKALDFGMLSEAKP